MGVPYLEAVVAFTACVFAFYSHVDVRQLKATRQPEPPKEIAGQVDKNTYQKMQAYQLDRWQVGFAYNLVDFLVSIAVLWYGAMPWLWARCGDLLGALGWTASWTVANQEVAQTVLLIYASSAISMLTDIPWSMYNTFVIEQRHGFNKQTLSCFIGDQVKAVALGTVLIPIAVGPLTKIMQVASPYTAIYLWGFTCTFSLFMMTIYPVAIAPLFNKFEPLKEGPLKKSIETLAGSLKFPLRKLYVMDGSKRSGHSNAYMYGFFKNKRIVLYDTLCKQCNENEVVAVLAHELGHWKLGHTLALFLVTQAIQLSHFSLFTLVRTSDDLFTSFGFVDSRPVFVAFMLFTYISAPTAKVIGLLANAITRRFEFQADAFAVSLGHSSKLSAALLKLEKENLSVLHVDPWYSRLHYSHPPLVERMAAIRLKSVDGDVNAADAKKAK
eukprot:CAMPEP_0117661988 /NCGR_PEP_ID=MMETSP0804-20121206/7823_1 /TAXON_ID=1074897 /ORGANISM="Tetraselmis astigmatica, Strain CCMP880" /LENGTH=439 /DNA_ID=CAMNT_0005468877 /DNA_START=465 /DNA_END=1784 /DNA_ORIENTATION=+